jgi:hypothetical protein
MSNEIDRSLIGLSVKGKNTDFGQITELVEVKHDNEFVIIAIMSTGKNLSLDSIRKLFVSQKLTLKRDEKGNCIPIVYPDGSAFSKYAVGTKSKQTAYPVCVANVNNTAIIGDEKINITKLVNSNDPIKYERI